MRHDFFLAYGAQTHNFGHCLSVRCTVVFGDDTVSHEVAAFLSFQPAVHNEARHELQYFLIFNKIYFDVVFYMTLSRFCDTMSPEYPLRTALQTPDCRRTAVELPTRQFTSNCHGSCPQCNYQSSKVFTGSYYLPVYFQVIGNSATGAGVR